jgi:hypothetical protein
VKVAIFGASVSAQALNHTTGEVTGYSEVLFRNYASQLNITDFRRVTYAGNRASDGGLILLEQVIAFAPDICLFEPLIEDMTRGTRITEIEIDYIYHRLLAAGILPVTVMLPNPMGKPPSNNWPEKARYLAVCTKFNLPVIQIDLTKVEDITEKFNGIHTLAEGAKIYAAQIAAGLEALGDLTAYPAKEAPPASKTNVLVQQVALPTPKPDSIVKLGLTLTFPDETDTRIRLIQFQSIGPFSPVLDVTTRAKALGKPDQWTNMETTLRSVWDPYCHYARQSFVTLSDLQSTGHGMIELNITCATTDPDYAACRREVETWPTAQERCLKPLGPLTLISNGPVKIALNDFQ